MVNCPRKAYRSYFCYFLIICSLIIIEPNNYAFAKSESLTSIAGGTQYTDAQDWIIPYPVISLFGHRFDHPVKLIIKTGPAEISCLSIPNVDRYYYGLEGGSVINHSSHTMSKVKIRWSLIKENGNNSILEIWETGSIELGELLPDEGRKLNRPTEFKRVFRALGDEKEEDEELAVELEVYEVVYKDGKTWRRD